MNRRILTALLAACIISGGFTYLLARKLQLTMALQHRAMVRYVAPARALEAGEVIKAGDLDWAEWPAADALQGALGRSDAAVGRVVLYPLDKGQPILDRDLSAPGSGVGLSSRIPAGMRAVALRSDEVVGVGGFLAPASRVDVLVTFHTAESKEALTATVLQNAEVLAAGQQIEPDPMGKPTTATVVTLLLAPEEAERAVAASTQGAIHFVLRNALDKTDVQSAPVSVAAFSPATHAAAPQPARPRPATGRGPERNGGSGVETIFGNEGAGEGGKASSQEEIQGGSDGAGARGKRKEATAAPVIADAADANSSMVARSQP